MFCMPQELILRLAGFVSLRDLQMLHTNISGKGGFSAAFILLRGDSMVTIDRDPIGKVEIPVVHRFAKHVLDAMEGK